VAAKISTGVKRTVEVVDAAEFAVNLQKNNKSFLLAE
jgi:hypothetical protein